MNIGVRYDAHAQSKSKIGAKSVFNRRYKLASIGETVLFTNTLCPDLYTVIVVLPCSAIYSALHHALPRRMSAAQLTNVNPPCQWLCAYEEAEQRLVAPIGRDGTSSTVLFIGGLMREAERYLLSDGLHPNLLVEVSGCCSVICTNAWAV